MRSESEQLATLYAARFSATTHSPRVELWNVLTNDFFQDYVESTDTVLDVAAGSCEFINAVKARRRIAVDLNPDVAKHAGPGVETIVTRASTLDGVDDRSVDVAFASNILEHLERSEILAVMSEARRVLRPRGRFLILQPNIRFCARDYWMFFDHITPLDDRSVSEALQMTGFSVTEVIPRFLPYSTKSRLPQQPWMVKAYLRSKPAWRLLGKQSFIVASPSG